MSNPEKARLDPSKAESTTPTHVSYLEDRDGNLEPLLDLLTAIHEEGVPNPIIPKGSRVFEPPHSTNK